MWADLGLYDEDRTQGSSQWLGDVTNTAAYRDPGAPSEIFTRHISLCAKHSDNYSDDQLRNHRRHTAKE